MAYRKIKGSYKAQDASTAIVEDTYLFHDTVTGELRIGDGVTPGGTLVTTGGGGSSSSLGDLTAVGSTLSAPSNADLTLQGGGTGAVVVEGLNIQGTAISTEDSSTGIEIAGNLIPSQDGVYQLGSPSRRWDTLYVAASTVDLGGATISSDGTGALTIAASGAVLPTGSKVQDNPIQIQGATSGTAPRPIQQVKVFTTDGSSSLTDAQILDTTAVLTLEFNATVDTEPVYTAAGQKFTLSNGSDLEQQDSVTLFQF